MCFVDTSVSVDIDPDQLGGSRYKCLDCKSTFKGIGKKVTCPSCDSTNVEKV